VGNDFGFEDVFARPVGAFGRQGDVLLLLSTSGQSPNLVKAAVAGRNQGMRVVALLGRGGGALRTLCDLAHIVPGNTADRIQELHMLALHALIEAVEARLEP
jgi:D-sedoheptulose 7-phosphate isomerase